MKSNQNKQISPSINDPYHPGIVSRSFTRIILLLSVLSSLYVLWMGSDKSNLTEITSSKTPKTYNKVMHTYKRVVLQNDTMAKNTLIYLPYNDLPAHKYHQPNHSYNPYHSSYSGLIMMDWSLNSNDFNYINYKSLESILFVYPFATIIINLVGPEKANYYKLGNLISKPYFQKYIKMGFKLKVHVQYLLNKKVNNNNNLGEAYWNETFSKCCTVYKTNDIRFGTFFIPLHLFFFTRIHELYLHGGLYVDFGWYHNNPIVFDSNFNSNNSNKNEGVIINIICNENINNKNNNNKMKRKCISSSIMIFDKHSVVLLCMLQKYDTKNSNLRECLNKNDVSEGVTCIQIAFDDCFQSNHIINIFTTNNNKVNKYNDNISKDLSNHMNAIVSIGNSTSFFNVSQFYNISYYEENLWFKPFHHFNNNNNSNNFPRFSDSKILWLGYSAHSGEWIIPYKKSFLSQQISSLKLKYPNSYQYEYRQSQKSIHYCFNNLYETVNNNNNNSSHYLGHNNCQYYDSSSLKGSFKRQAKSSCGINFVLAGFMKAGSSYLYDSLMGHPFIIQALRGVQFKETGCYLPDSMRPNNAKNRMNCFPFIEKSEPFIYGDGTISYATRQE
eukprot:gene12839-17213_t